MLSVLVTVVPALAETFADTTLLVDAALAGMALVLVATFGLVWNLNQKMGRVEGALFGEPFGALTLLEKMVGQLEAVERRVAHLERE